MLYRLKACLWVLIFGWQLGGGDDGEERGGRGEERRRCKVISCEYFCACLQLHKQIKVKVRLPLLVKVHLPLLLSLDLVELCAPFMVNWPWEWKDEAKEELGVGRRRCEVHTLYEYALLYWIRGYTDERDVSCVMCFKFCYRIHIQYWH